MSLTSTIISRSSVVVILFFSLTGFGQKEYDEKHIEVSLRMIGHELLLSDGDSTTRVLPIKKANDQYTIEFESEFGFVPDKLIIIANDVMNKTNIASGYFLEVEECESNEVIYSFEMGSLDSAGVLPCRERAQPKACYRLIFTLIGRPGTEELPDINIVASNPRKSKGIDLIRYLFLAISLISLLAIFLWKRKKKPMHDPNIISLGKYDFDTRRSELKLKEERIELTSKEADLLTLLHENANQTVERERILNVVWEDDGDYVGRTLDVFISKLRKKLEADPSIKIANIRGVGYKLVIGD